MFKNTRMRQLLFILLLVEHNLILHQSGLYFALAVQIVNHAATAHFRQVIYAYSTRFVYCFQGRRQFFLHEQLSSRRNSM